MPNRAKEKKTQKPEKKTISKTLHKKNSSNGASKGIIQTKFSQSKIRITKYSPSKPSITKPSSTKPPRSLHNFCPISIKLEYPFNNADATKPTHPENLYSQPPSPKIEIR